MATLRFKPQDVRRVVDHAKAASNHREYFGEQIGPSALLVKDDGIYLMSNGVPRDLEQPTGQGIRADMGERTFVAYAAGFNPEKDRNVWECSRDAVGGDDFGEPIELTALEAALTPAAGYEVIAVVLELTDTKVSIQSAERKLS